MKRITIKEVQEILKKNGVFVSRESVTRWCKNGVISGAIKIGGSWHVTPEAVNLLLNPQ